MDVSSGDRAACRREETMYEKTPAEHFSEAINRLSKLPHPFAEAGRSPTEQPPASVSEPTRGQALTICFSREAGSGGITVAREVGRRLNWPVYDQELLENLARELKVDISFVEDYDERRGSWLVDCIKAFSSSASVSEVTYFHRLVRMLQALGARGECLIVGRGSAFILPPETTLRVRIVASREDRIAFIAGERHLDRAEAVRFVDTRDRDRLKFIKDHFHKDPSDPLGYDVIVNRSRFSVEETAELVIEALQRMQARRFAPRASGA
jgi:cytidylate kinase